ncbi:MAG: hypothetical protein GY940_19300, partial [bacterium]|nr:hypothetical protein [bacterium]
VHPADIVTGQDIRSIIGERFDDAPAKPAAGKVDLIWDSFSRGQCFWDVVKKPFLSRDLNRDEVKALISRGLVETGGRYNQLLKIFNMEENDYHRFMRFLHSQELLPVTRSSDRRG